jgi:16S rRNA processing protein RimM
MPLKIGNDAGSRTNSEPAFLVLGKLRRAHGVAGEIALDVYTSMFELLEVKEVVFVGETYQPYTIQATRWKGDLLLLKFEGVNDRALVSQLTNALIYTRTDQLPKLDEDEFYLHQLIGLDVYDTDHHLLGVLTEILETGANDVYLVKDQTGAEVLIAAVDERIVDIDLEAGKMIVSKIEWYGEGDG